MPTAHVKRNHVPRLGFTYITGHFVNFLLQLCECLLNFIMKRIPIRAGDDSERAAVRPDRLEIPGKLDAKAILSRIDIVIGMPARIADVAVGAAAHSKNIVAIELLRRFAETRVLKDSLKERRLRPEHRNKLPLAAVKGSVCVGGIEAPFEFLRNSRHFFGIEKSAQDNKTECLVVKELLIGEHF